MLFAQRQTNPNLLLFCEHDSQSDDASLAPPG